MKKIIWIIIGIAVLVIAYFLISPLFIDNKIMEDFPTDSEKSGADKVQTENGSVYQDEDEDGKGGMEFLSEGSFQGLAGHSAQGTAKLIKTGEKKYIRFEDDFEITNGPDLFVHLGSNDQYDKEANLGELKGNIGSQNYEIPDDLDIENYDEVWVWCRAFSVPFGKAELK